MTAYVVICARCGRIVLRWRLFEHECGGKS